MTIRAEMNMKLAKCEWNVDFNENKKTFELTLDEKPLLTPGGNPVAHNNERFLYHMLAELRCLKTLDKKLNSLWLYSSAVDHQEKLKTVFSLKEVRTMLLQDPTLARCAEPNLAMAQMGDWGPLNNYFSKNQLEYPDFPQGEDREEYLRELGDESVQVFAHLVRKVTCDIEPLTVAQKCVIANAKNCYGSFIWGFLLATNQSTPLEFATGIAATQCALPWAFSDVKLEEYAEAIKGMAHDALLMRTFVEMF